MNPNVDQYIRIKTEKMTYFINGNTEEKKAFNIEFWRFLWASILIGLSACLGNVVDAMIVGNLIDEDSVSAINLSLPTPSSQTSLTLNCLRN